ncbi:hypothetical protein QYE76_039471 [Lolium multiflorum]|uniref:Uncharacterized protein n=1 Tax=Lolium multiflorum TaxID=4521 RepID=A0AAD8TBG3_LOLMU|nr:hypothetical protein QYE76_039471 [Lolium multiflorum]
MENYSLLMGAAVMKMAVEMTRCRWRSLPGTSPLRQGAEQRPVPGSWLRAAALGFCGFRRTPEVLGRGLYIGGEAAQRASGAHTLGGAPLGRVWCGGLPLLRGSRVFGCFGRINVPLAKRAKLAFKRAASTKESDPSPAKSTPPTRAAVEKIPVSKVNTPGDPPASLASRDHPIYATIDAVADFAEQFTRLEAENAQLRKSVKTSADQVLEANRFASDVKNENALLKKELSKLKQQMKDEQEARRAAAIAVDKKEGVLRESVKDLLEAANITVSRRHQLRVDSTVDALSLAAESNVQVLGLLQKTKGALSRLYSMIFPKMKQDKTLDELADAFLVDPSEPMEVLKRRSRVIGAVLTFQLLMGHGMGSELEEFSKALPVDDDNHLVDLEPFKRSAISCANRLLKLVDEA